MTSDPERISKYRIIAKIGEGGMASVYLGVMCGPSNFTKLLVIKVLRRDLAEDPHILSMFLDEARIAARLNHANVVDTYEIGEDQGRHFIAMEYLQGQPYSAVVKRLGAAEFPLPVQLKVLSSVLEGLYHVHELRDFDGSRLGLVHRDVSPQNVFINYDGQVKIVDFGIAKAACSAASTRAGVIKGKISYLAPEQARGGEVDHRADLFAVGVMLWEAISQRRFTVGQIDAATIHRRIQGIEPRIREVVPDVPLSLARICDRALEIEPDHRFGTALEFQHALEAYREESGHRVEPREVGRMVAQAFAAERFRLDRLIEDNTATVVMQPPAGEDLVTSKSVVAVPDEDPAARPSRSRRWWVPVVVVGALLFLGAVFYLGRATGPSHAHSPGTPSASSGGESPVALAPLSSSVHLRIHVRPPDATLSLDGEPLGANPYEGSHARDLRQRRVEARAPGHETEAWLVVLDCDTNLERELRPAQDASVPPKLPDPKDSSRPAPTDRFPSVGDDLRGNKPKPGQRTIDPTDPYTK